MGSILYSTFQHVPYSPKHCTLKRVFKFATMDPLRRRISLISYEILYRSFAGGYVTASFDVSETTPMREPTVFFPEKHLTSHDSNSDRNGRRIPITPYMHVRYSEPRTANVHQARGLQQFYIQESKIKIRCRGEAKFELHYSIVDTESSITGTTWVCHRLYAFFHAFVADRDARKAPR